MEDKKLEFKQQEVLADNWGVLTKYTLDYTDATGHVQEQVREVYDRGNGAATLLFNPNTQHIVLTKQFRLPTYLNGNAEGSLIEVCAGQLDDQSPEQCIKREIEEETGYRINSVQQVLEAYMSPGSVTEKIYFFTAAYTNNMKVSDGGGLDEEQENIEVLEIPFAQAIRWMQEGKIQDAKTIILLQYALLNSIFENNL